MAGDPNDEDDTFRVQATKEVSFMNRDLQARGFECLVEHHDIERVTSSEDRIHISCVVSVLEDDCIEVPAPSVQRSICESIAAQAPMEVVFHVGAECRVIRAIRADVVLMVNFRQPSHEFTFGVGIDLISKLMILTLIIYQVRTCM